MASTEISLRKQWVNNRLMAWLFGVFALGFWAASYEIIDYYQWQDGDLLRLSDLHL
jgi:hypothetical protein